MAQKKYLGLLCCCVPLSQFPDLTEDEFLNIFDLPPVDDPQEQLKRVQALKEYQQAVLVNNKAYQAGKRTWFEGINP